MILSIIKLLLKCIFNLYINDNDNDKFKAIIAQVKVKTALKNVKLVGGEITSDIPLDAHYMPWSTLDTLSGILF